MAAGKGSLVLLKVGNNGNPEVFTTVGGLITTEMILSNEIKESTNRNSGSWRQINATGVSRLRITGRGLFTNAASEETLRSYIFGNLARNYELGFSNNSKVSGSFIVTEYHRMGDIDSEEQFSIILESAGTITYTP